MSSHAVLCKRCWATGLVQEIETSWFFSNLSWTGCHVFATFKDWCIVMLPLKWGRDAVKPRWRRYHRASSAHICLNSANVRAARSVCSQKIEQEGWGQSGEETSAIRLQSGTCWPDSSLEYVCPSFSIFDRPGLFVFVSKRLSTVQHPGTSWENVRSHNLSRVIQAFVFEYTCMPPENISSTQVIKLYP